MLAGVHLSSKPEQSIPGPVLLGQGAPLVLTSVRHAGAGEMPPGVK